MPADRPWDVDPHEVEPILTAVERDLRRNGLGSLTRPKRHPPVSRPAKLVAAAERKWPDSGLVAGIRRPWMPALLVLLWWALFIAPYLGTVVYMTSWALLIGAGLTVAMGSIDDPLAHRSTWWTRYRPWLVAMLVLLVIAIAVDVLRTGSLSTVGANVALMVLSVAAMIAVSTTARVGLPSLALNAGAAIVRALPATLAAAGRATPVAFAVLFVGFFTGEAWQIIEGLSGSRYVALVCLPLVVSVLAAAGAASAEVQRLMSPTERSDAATGDRTPRPARPEPWTSVRSARERLRLEPVPLDDLGAGQRINIGLAFFAVILVRVLLVSALAGATFLAVGFIVADDRTAGVLLDEATATQDSLPLIRISLLLGAVATLTFSATALTTEEHRRHLLADQSDRLAARLLEWQDYASLVEYRVGELARRIGQLLPTMEPGQRRKAVRGLLDDYGAHHHALRMLADDLRRLDEGQSGG